MKVKLANENFKDRYTEQLLLSRGVTNLEAFYNPTEDLLQAPWYLDNIDDGIDLYKNIVEDADNHIGIVVD